MGTTANTTRTPRRLARAGVAAVLAAAAVGAGCPTGAGPGNRAQVTWRYVDFVS